MEVKKTFKSMDGNEAAAYGSYAFTEVAGIFPITPSSPMAEHVDAWSAKGKKNIFGNPVKVVEMQSEGGASGTVHGAAQGGTLATTYTASQGLLLMIPNIYKVVGELLPVVFHVSARSLATRSLSIFGDHQDIYAVRQTGIPMICAHSVQEVADLSPVAHAIAIKAAVPMLHFFDGFRTSHEIQKVELIDYANLAELLDKEALADFKARALDPRVNPVTRGGAENDDIYFQGREAQNLHYANVVKVAEELFEKISVMTGRDYAPFTYYGSKDAEKVIIAMGSVTETIKEVVDAAGGKIGLIKVHLYRPFSAQHLLKVLPASVKKIAVLDRTKEIGATGEPLFLDVYEVIKSARPDIEVIGGRYGLSSKDTQPNQIKAVYDNLDAKEPIKGFTIGINDDVTHLSLAIDPKFHVKANYTACLFYGLGSDGTVSANKSSIKIIGDHTDLYAQAYFAYDSRKAGGTTRSNLRFGSSPIRSTYYVSNADFISCSLDSYLLKFNMVKDLKEGGTFLLNTTFSAEEIVKVLPNRYKQILAERNAKFYIINATKIADEIGMGRRTNTILQSAFFKLNPSILPYEKAVEYMKAAALKSYGSKGEAIVQMNYKAIDVGGSLIEEIAIDPTWAKLNVVSKDTSRGDEYFDEFVDVMEGLGGYDLPVSTFTKFGLLDGTMHNDITFKQKRDIAAEVPTWNKDNCIQCGKCTFVCPHATIRAFALTADEVANAPELIKNDVAPVLGKKDYFFKIQVSPLNCVGCALCVTECPGKGGNKALTMVDVKTQKEQEKAADYLYKELKTAYKSNLFPTATPKGASLLRPYFEVSGACAGCGETPYYRLATQLFGKDMMIANATGCSSIYSGSTPGTPFATDENGEGPAWANSLFEDNAEFGFGMRTATNYKLEHVANIILANLESVEPELKEVLTDYLAHQRDIAYTRGIKEKLLNLVRASSNQAIKELVVLKDDLIDKSVWIIGGDGWAYDIDYGGLDHVLASEENINVLVLDTEVYSNTGGQASKSTQTGAIAQFAAAGKKAAKKDLGAIAMQYQNVYVAAVAMGANNMQVIKAMKEAESYQGPSIIIAYAPCQEHGIKGGLSLHQQVQKKAVECGYVPLYRYDPRLADQGKNPLQLDFTTPDFSKFREFVMTQVRYNQLPVVNPEHAEELFNKSQKYAKQRFDRLVKLSKETVE